MKLKRSDYTYEQQCEIEHSIYEAMEVARVNTLREAHHIAKQAYNSDNHRAKGAYKAYHQACTRIMVKLEIARKKGLPYDPFFSHVDGPQRSQK